MDHNETPDTKLHDEIWTETITGGNGSNKTNNAKSALYWSNRFLEDFRRRFSLFRMLFLPPCCSPKAKKRPERNALPELPDSLTFDVAHAIAGAVLERPRVDLIEHGRLPPIQAVRNAALGLAAVPAICRGRVAAIAVGQVQQQQDHAAGNKDARVNVLRRVGHGGRAWTEWRAGAGDDGRLALSAGDGGWALDITYHWRRRMLAVDRAESTGDGLGSRGPGYGKRRFFFNAVDRRMSRTEWTAMLTRPKRPNVVPPTF